MTRTTLAIATAFGAALLTVPACRRKAVQGGDTRTAVLVPVEARDAILAEMRTMLGSMNGILNSVVSGDTASIRSAASASGTAMAADPALEQILPEQFLRMGMNTHQQFDSLAAAIGAGAPRDTAIARLARLTGNCVSCHAQYRLVLR
ncbi:MAG TPA: hypothetical protein VLB49_01945 [Gemmatimonadales bacterium]|nr:hypothetical protein [Gemmatimonadales bacterium]